MISIQYDKISLNIPYGGVKRISKGLIFFITRPPIIGGGPIVTVLPCPVIPMIRRTSGISWFISLLIPGRFSSLSSKSRSCRNSCTLSNASAVVTLLFYIKHSAHSVYVPINNPAIVVCVVRVRKVQDGLTVLVWFQSNNKLGVQIDNLVIDMHFNVFGHNVKCLFVIRCYSLSTYSFSRTRKSLCT